MQLLPPGVGLCLDTISHVSFRVEREIPHIATGRATTIGRLAGLTTRSRSSCDVCLQFVRLAAGNSSSLPQIHAPAYNNRLLCVHIWNCRGFLSLWPSK